MTGNPIVTLRAVEPGDIPVFYAQQMDPESNRMAAFTPSDAGDPDAFEARWRGLMANPACFLRTIVANGVVAGNVLAFDRDGMREVGYWVDRSLWGRGIGRAALAQMLEIETTRPIYARIASDNIGSRRIAERCGFTQIGSEPIEGEGRDEILYELR